MAAASREFQVMAKPAGALCNLGCRYCYYLVKKDLYPAQSSQRMADDLLEAYIVQHIEACPTELILFSWHGGEPTVLGIDFFRRVVELQRKHRPEGRRIVNGIQTNGVLIDEEWCRFLAREGFHIGLSIDGPKELHDRYRVTRNGRATHKQVLAAYRMLRKSNVPCDLLCVVNDRTVRQPSAVYRFLKDLGVPYMQFLPLVIPAGDGGVDEKSVPAAAYGEFLCTIFDEWMRNDVGRIAIQYIEEALRPAMGWEHALCIHREVCGDIVVVEHNGDFYSCDHFVTPEHRIGNIRETPLAEMLESEAQRDFANRKRDSLPQYCRACEVLAWCNGGCPKDRFLSTPDGEPGLNYLCEGLKMFFTHARPYLERMAALQKAGLRVDKVSETLRRDTAAVTHAVGRNDPCPCGSGRKYKKCCLGKTGLGSGVH